MTRPWLLVAAVLCAGPVLAQETAPCLEQAGRVYAFQAPPVAPPALREALRAGRAYLARGEARIARCGASAAGLRSGYVIGTLAKGKVSFSAPEPLPPALRRCLEQAAERLDTPPPLPRGAAEVRRLFVLRAPERERPSPGARSAAGRRTQEEIAAEVGRHLPGLSACFEALWQERPDAAGTLTLRLTLGEHGGVEVAEVVRREPALEAAESCVLEVAGRLRFSPRWGGGRTLLTYPLILTGPM